MQAGVYIGNDKIRFYQAFLQILHTQFFEMGKDHSLFPQDLFELTTRCQFVLRSLAQCIAQLRINRSVSSSSSAIGVVQQPAKHFPSSRTVCS